MTPLVSILIPCHNAAPWLAATLDSALAQTWPKIEVIVVDDGSTDDSLALARSFTGRGVRVLEQPNRGACAARNRARRSANGDFIQYLDADDLLLPDKIARQISVLTAPGFTGSLVSAEWARFNGEPATATSCPDELWQDQDAVTWETLALAKNLMMHPAAWLMTRSLCEAVGDWDESLTLNDDGEYFSRARFMAGHIRFVAGARSLYRSGIPGSLSSPNSRRALASAFHSHELIHRRLLDRQDTPGARQACADAWMHFAFVAAPIAPDLADRAEQAAGTLGGSRLKPAGGRFFRAACQAAGWRRAVRWRHFLNSIRP